MKPSVRNRRIGWAVICLSALVMLVWTWSTWPDPIVDFGRELYVPWRLSAGEVLYRDIAYFNAPVSPYFNAGIFRIFGVGLWQLIIANLAIATALVVMIHRIWQAIAGELAALIACVVFVTVFACLRLSDVGNYNFLTPYSHELTHGVVLSFAAITCTLAYARQPKLGWLVLAGALLGLVFLTKPEVCIAASGATATGIALSMHMHRLRGRNAALALVAFASATIAVVAIAVLWLSRALPFREASHAVFGAWNFVFDARITAMPFYQHAMGTRDLRESAVAILAQAASYALIVIAAIVFAWRLRAERWQRSGPLIAAGISTATMLLLYRFVNIDWAGAFRGVVVWMAFVCLLVSIDIVQSWRELSTKRILRVTVSAFAMILLAKIALNVRTQHYGFALAMPAVLLLIAAAISWLPNWLRARGANGNVAVGTILPVIALFVFVHLHAYAVRFSNQPFHVGSGADAFRADERGRAVNSMVRLLDAALPRDATLAVVPEGATINYLTRRRNPTGYINLMPPEITMFAQEQILDAFDRHRPDFVLLVQSDPRDYGYRSFDEYAGQIYAWIQSHYTAMPTPEDPALRMRLMRKNRVDAP